MSVLAYPQTSGPSPQFRTAANGRWNIPAVLGYGLYYALITVLLIYPALMLAWGTFHSGPPGAATSFTLRNLGSFLHDEPIWRAIRNSIFLATVTTMAGMLLALGLAYAAQRTDALFRTLITPAMVLTFATPPLFYALGYSLLANKYNGLLNIGMRSLLGINEPIVNIESWSGISLVMSLRSTAFIYLFVAGPIAALNRTHEDASYISGAGPIRTAIMINVGILMPAITGAAILAFLAGIQTFDTALIIADPAGIRVIATQVFTMLLAQVPPDYGVASALSMFLFLIVFLLVVIQNRLLAGRSFVTREGKATSAERTALGAWRYAFGAFIMTYLIIDLFLPMSALAISSFQPFPGVFGRLTTVHYVRAFTAPGIWDAIWTTVILSVSVGGAAMALAVLIVVVSRKAGIFGAGYLRFAVLLPKAMPGVVMALAITWAYVSLPGLRLIYGTIWIMFLALIVVVVPFTLQAAQSAIAQVGRDLSEASLVSGASRFVMVRTILVPLIAPSIIYGWFIAAVIVAGTLDIPLLLASPGLATLAAKIYELNFSGSIGDAAALLVALLAFLSLLALCGLAMGRLAFSRNQ